MVTPVRLHRLPPDHQGPVVATFRLTLSDTGQVREFQATGASLHRALGAQVFDTPISDSLRVAMPPIFSRRQELMRGILAGQRRVEAGRWVLEVIG